MWPTILVDLGQLCLKFGTNLKEMRWFKKRKHAGLPQKTSKHQDRKLKSHMP